MIKMPHHVQKIKASFANIINYGYLVVDSASMNAALIDPAWEISKFQSIISDLGLRLTSIFLTHSHYDHVNLAETLANQYNAQVYMSKKEIDFYKFKCPNLNSFNNNDKIYIGQTSIICLETPGHTHGGICFLLSDSLFTGDTIFIEGCGICCNYGGDPQEMYHSIQFIKNNISPDVKIYPGHSFGKNPGYPLNYLLKENIYFQFESIEHFVKFRMRPSQPNLFDFK
jgi:hydroxyacylglutathione hydrolase